MIPKEVMGRTLKDVSFHVGLIRQVDPTRLQMSVEMMSMKGEFIVPITMPFASHTGMIGGIPTPGTVVILLNPYGHSIGQESGLMYIPVAYLAPQYLEEYFNNSIEMQTDMAELRWLNQRDLQPGNVHLCSSQNSSIFLSNMLSITDQVGDSILMFPDDRSMNISCGTLSQSLSGVLVRAGRMVRSGGNAVNLPSLRTVYFPNPEGYDLFSEADSDSMVLAPEKRPLSEFRVRLDERASIVPAQDNMLYEHASPTHADLYTDTGALDFQLGVTARDSGDIWRPEEGEWSSEDPGVEPSASTVIISTTVDMSKAGLLHFSLDESELTMFVDKEGKMWYKSGVSSTDGTAFEMYFKGEGKVWLNKGDDDYSLKVTTVGSVMFRVGDNYSVQADGYLKLRANERAELGGKSGVQVFSDDAYAPGANAVLLGGSSSAEDYDVEPDPDGTFEAVVTDAQLAPFYNIHIHYVPVGGMSGQVVIPMTARPAGTTTSGVTILGNVSSDRVRASN